MIYCINFTIGNLEFTTEKINSETEMLQKREKLKTVADNVKVVEYVA